MMASYCYEQEIDTMIIGGDLLHGKSVIYAIAQNLMLEFFRRHRDLTFYVIDGNHDLASRGQDAVSALVSLDSEDNVKRCQDTSCPLQNMLLVPYSSSMIPIIKNNKADILISHFGLNEGVLNSGLSIISDLGVKDLAGRYKIVLLGHYHKPQEIITDDIQIYYAGSPIQLDWGEKHDEKRFLVVDSEKLEVESVLTNGYKPYIEFELRKDNIDKVVKAAEICQKAGAHVRIIKKESIDISKVKDFVVVDKSDKDITNRGITKSMSDDDVHMKYLEIREIPESDYSLYMDVAKEIDQMDEST
jgi:DNA repair exonuclease SbcCD nuclease subunit